MIETLKGWLTSYMNYKTIPDLIKGNMGKDLKQSLLLVLFSQFLAFIAVALSFAIALSLSGKLSTLSGIILALIGPAAVGVALFYVISLLMYGIARAIGGKGAFNDQCFAFAIIQLCNSMLSLPLIIISQVPQIGVVASIIALLLAIYSIFVQYKAITIIHTFSKWYTAIMILLASWVFLFILDSLIAIFLGAAPA